MERQKIFPVLFAVLLAASVFLGVYFFVMYRNINYLPEEGLDDLCEILASDGILLDKGIVPLKKETGTVYVCDSEEYGVRVAGQLGESEIKYRFAVPDGEMILLQNGVLLAFGEDFFFRYRLDETTSYTDGALEEAFFGSQNLLPPQRAEKECGAAKAFLERGSSGFLKQDQLKLAIEVGSVSEKDGVYYVECIRTIDGLRINGNRVVCAVVNGVVAEAAGIWSFLSGGEAYSSQLTDIFNILFRMKKEIEKHRASEELPVVTVKGIERCYTLLLSGENSGLCFVPCWKIVTEECGNFVYNAIDGSLCTE